MSTETHTAAEARRRHAASTPERGTKSTNEEDKAIGGRMRAARGLKKMTQEELAEKLGLTFQQIQKYEKGVNRIAGGRIRLVCKILDMTPNWLILGEEIAAGTGREQLELSAAVTRFLASKGTRGAAFLASMGGLGAREVKIVFAMVNVLAANK